MNQNAVLKRGHDKNESNVISILVICNCHFLKQLTECLHEKHNKGGWKYKLKIITCENVQEILAHTNELPIDYVVFVLDTRNKTCVTEVEFNLQLMDQSLVCGRTCIVNGNCFLPLREMNVPSNSISALKLKYNFPLLNADIMDRDSCLDLASRLLTLVRAMLGINLSAAFVPWLHWNL